jgi:surfeit locus 1 family protein
VEGVSWRFARRPWWVLSHLMVLALVAAMVTAGMWQLRRLDDQRAVNALIEARAEQPVVDVREVVPLAGTDATPEGVVHRRVVATGTYAEADTVLVDNRTYEGAPGGWVLTPLVLDDGSAVVVNRGFIGFTREGGLVAPPAPQGTVLVEGLLQASQQRGSFGPTDPSEGRLEVLARADLPRIEAQVDYPVLPVYLQRTASDPGEPEPAAGAPVLVAVPEPDLADGPHLSYAVQWFIFTAIALVGYPLVLRRIARQEAGPGRRPDDGQGPRGGDDPGPGAPDGDGNDDLDRELRDLLAAEGG